MSVLLFTHDACLDHDTGPGHPEHPGRLRAVLDSLAGPDFAWLERRVAPEASVEELRLAHPQQHLDRVLAAIPAAGHAMLDADTIVSPGSREAALRAAGAVCRAVEAVCAGPATRAFCAVRPPGHHAEAGRAMGFCLFNNIAVGAALALHRGLAERVAIIDFDVHHGNGTQDIFWNDGRALYCSTHQAPLYPGTGDVEECGAVENVFNLPLSPGSGGGPFREAWSRIGEAIDRFRPDLILVSAGFDGHRLDPLADLALATEDFAWLSGSLAELADSHCAGRLVSALEGGYSLEALRESVPAYLRAQRP